MIRLTEITVEGVSSMGRFAGGLRLGPGLQIISASNSYGKSLAATAAAWCLGAEAMFGTPDNDPTCFPVAAREELDLGGHTPASVTSSMCTIGLQHLDGRTLRLSRDIKGDPSVVRIEQRSREEKVQRFKLNARRAAMQDEHGGLQRFLFEWLQWPRESVLTLSGTSSHVYMENLTPLFYIDQNEGWTDIQSLQIRRYGQLQIIEIAVEYLLGAIEAIRVRVGRQTANLREASLRESARNLGESITDFFRRHAWGLEWSGNGSIDEILSRWSSRTIRDVLLSDANVDLSVRSQSLEARASALQRALTTDPIDPADTSSARAASQLVVNLKRRRHEFNEQMRTLTNQQMEFSDLLTSLEHRIHSAKDILRFKTTGVGRLDNIECPTCHREIDPATFALTRQSEQSVAAHIDALNRDRELMASNVESLRARLIETESEIKALDVQLRDAERSLTTVTAAIGSVREQLAKTAGDLSATERMIDGVREAVEEIGSFQKAVNKWIDDAKAIQQLSQAAVDIRPQTNAFVEALQQYLVALGHSAVQADGTAGVRLDERYTPYLDNRRLRSLGSASDQSRLIAAYTLALAAASNRVAGFHPGLVLLDEPLQQNPDDPHRDLFIRFLNNQIARNASFQTIVFTFLRPSEIEALRTAGVNVALPAGSHFLRLESESNAEPTPA